jgi:hypothetical protein
MLNWLRDRALTLVLMALFVVFLAAQMVTGLYEYNATQREHGEPLASMTDYLATGHPWEALFENWPVRRGGWILRLYEHSLGLAVPPVVGRPRPRRFRG